MVSPENRTPAWRSSRQIPPGEWPGVCMTSKTLLPGQGLLLTRMNNSFPEFVHAPDVIVVRVSRDRDHPLGGVCEPGEHPGQRSDPGARVHDQVSLRSADMIEIRADQGVHVRLGYQRDAISHLSDRKPGAD